MMRDVRSWRAGCSEDIFIKFVMVAGKTLITEEGVPLHRRC